MTKPTPPRPWKPGESGNPKGRPPGAGEVARLRAGIARHVPAIVRQLVKSAKGGDTAAARLLLERAIPAVRSTEQPIAVDIPAEGTLSDKARAVLASLAAGDIAPAHAAQLMGAVASLAQIQTADELAARIAALEARHSGPQ